jgi:hypothetical protein
MPMKKQNKHKELNAVIRELLQPEIELPVMTHLLLQQELD